MEKQNVILVDKLNEKFEYQLNKYETISNVLLNEKITYQNKKLNIIEASPNRTKPKCPNYFLCGGCNMQHINYQTQLEYKTNFVKELAKKHKINTTILNTIGSKIEYNYRNKMHYVLRNRNNKIVCGLYKEETREIIPLTECLTHDNIGNKIILEIIKCIKANKLSVYDEKKDFGNIKDVIIKTSNQTKEVLVVIVTKEEKFPGRNNFVKALKMAVPEITTIIQNIKPTNTAVILGNRELVIYGPGFITDILCGLKFRISSKSFYQINSLQTEKLYQKAIELAKIKDSETILDLYCGVGTIGLIASKKANKLIGVEIVKEAIQNAIQNAKINNIRNAQFFAEDAKMFLQTKKIESDIVFVDPPRAGLDDEVIDSLIYYAPKRIVYISCNPITLFANLEKLSSHYTIKQIQPFDMFPQTHHIESVCLLELKK